jgi:CBS domain-containing membrane protein
MISVDEIMITNVFTLKPSDSVYDARALMKEKDIRHIPIVDDAGGLVGLVSQRDILNASESTLHATSAEQRLSLEKEHKIEEVMTRELKTIDERDSLRSAAVCLRKFKHGCLPVVTGGELRGIITDTDFVGVAVHLLEQVETGIPVEEV